ncbi:MAG: hypothetical protein FWD32_00090 [Firmicutes bacterium]|nr:hypothetical protein [Bacillota bacterium]
MKKNIKKSNKRKVNKKSGGLLPLVVVLLLVGIAAIGLFSFKPIAATSGNASAWWNGIKLPWQQGQNSNNTDTDQDNDINWLENLELLFEKQNNFSFDYVDIMYGGPDGTVYYYNGYFINPQFNQLFLADGYWMHYDGAYEFYAGIGATIQKTMIVSGEVIEMKNIIFYTSNQGASAKTVFDNYVAAAAAADVNVLVPGS